MSKDVYVVVKCIDCSHEEKIYSGEVEPGEYPTCSKCLGVTIAQEAFVSR